MAGELGIPDGPGTIRLADQEVGKTKESPVEEGGLENDIGTVAKHIHGRFVGCPQAGRGHLRTVGELLDAGPRLRVVVAVGRDQLLEDVLLMGVAKHRRAFEHLIPCHIRLGTQAELHIQQVQGLVIAVNRDRQVAR